MTRQITTLMVAVLLILIAMPASGSEKALNSVSARFAVETPETPDFQRHVVPLIGKLGCNGRACHGSFQGRGDFRLSLFGYDFKADHDELSGRSNVESPTQSLILQKPLTEIDHEGGLRFESNSWQHRLLLNWVKGDTPNREENAARLTQLKITPEEIQFNTDEEDVQLSAVAVWSDGVREDVTELCRFLSNDDQIADVDDNGFVTSGVPGDTHLVVFYDKAVVPVPVFRPVSSDKTGADYPATPAPTQIDHLVLAKLKKLGIVQSDLCTDQEFLRRASLDATGTLPSLSEIQSFIADSTPDKRSKKIDELLERPGYAAWWTTRLCDFTGNSNDQLNNVTPVRPAAAQHWYDWIHQRVEDNASYDSIVEGLVMAVSRDPGESYKDYCENMSHLYHRDSDSSYGDRTTMPHYWSRRNFQAMEDRVIGFSYAFLGIRLQCAQCHKHPFDQWTQQDFKQFQGFFTGVEGRSQTPDPKNRKEYRSMLAEFETGDLKGNQLRNELTKLLKDGKTVPFGEVFARPTPKPTTAKKNKKDAEQKKKRRKNKVATSARLLGGETIDLTAFDDIREPLMDWLRSPENPLFARAFVNRVWADYFNVGIVNPPDDMNLANPPSNAALLDYLANEFIAKGFDMKWLHRTIMNSRTYQLSWKPNATNRQDVHNFARAIPRRLPAEVAWDIVSQATSNDDKHSVFLTNMENRALAIPGSGIRNRGRRNNPAIYPLAIFGRSIRDSNCDCDRSADPGLLQTVFMRNDNQLLALIDGKDSWLAQVASENNVPFVAKSSANPDAEKARMKRLAQTRQKVNARLQQQQKRLKSLQGKTDKEAQVAQIKKQISKLKKRIKTLPADNKVQLTPTPNQSATIDIAGAVKSAYLRTLSRLPNEQEAAVATEAVTEAENQIDGLRNVMWALLNTKEFIVNH